MADETGHRPDRLAERIAKRRAQAQPDATEQQAAGTTVVEIPAVPVAPVEAAKPSEPAKKYSQEIEQRLSKAKEAIETGQNPMAVARLLGELIGLGMKNKDLAPALEVNKSWLSKKLSLNSAPARVRQLIESGGLPESDYHNTKNLTGQIKGKSGALVYKRMPTVTISIETAKSLASILRIIAADHGDSPIVLLPNASKKDVATLLDLRARSVLELIEQ